MIKKKQRKKCKKKKSKNFRDLWDTPNSLTQEWMGDGVLLYCTRNCVQSLGLEHDGKWKKKKKRMCVYGWVGLFAVQQKLKEYCKQTIF